MSNFSILTAMKLLRALVVVGVFLKAEGRRLENGADSRIVNGQVVDIMQYPYVVKLLGHERYICTGTIISAQTVLTAAHCVVLDNNIKTTGVTVFIKATEETIEASSIVAHAGYHDAPEDRASPNDIALIYLQKPSDYSFGFPKLYDQPSLPGPGTPLQIMGYGRTEAVEYPDFLSYIDTEIVNTQGIFPNTFLVSNGYGGSDNGDSGSPAILRYGGEHIVVGVFSAGGIVEEGQLYTSVSAFYRWIIPNIV